MINPQSADWSKLAANCAAIVEAKPLPGGYLEWNCPHCGLHALGIADYIEEEHDHKCPTDYGAGCGKRYTVHNGHSRTNL